MRDSLESSQHQEFPSHEAEGTTSAFQGVGHASLDMWGLPDLLPPYTGGPKDGRLLWSWSSRVGMKPSRALWVS